MVFFLGSPELMCEKSHCLEPPCWKGHTESPHRDGETQRTPACSTPSYGSLPNPEARSVSEEAFDDSGP